MPGAVGEGLDSDAVRRHLDRRGQRRKVGGVERDAQRPGVRRTQLVGLLAKGRQQPELVERRGAHAVDELTDLLDGGRGLGAQGPQQVVGPVGVVPQGVARRVGGEGDPGEARAQTVVKVAAQPPPLLLESGDGLLPGSLYVGGQRGGPKRLGQERGDQPEHVLVSLGQSEVPGTQAHLGSPTAPPPRARGRVRVCVTGTPEVASSAPSTRSPAYGRTSASRMARRARTGSSPIWSATCEAAPSGSGRSPNSSLSTTPRSSLQRVQGGRCQGADHAEHSDDGALAAQDLEERRGHEERQVARHGHGEDHAAHDQATDVDHVGPRGADVHGGGTTASRPMPTATTTSDAVPVPPSVVKTTTPHPQ